MIALKKVFLFVVWLWLTAMSVCASAQAPSSSSAQTPATEPAEKTVEVNRAAKVTLVEGDVAAFSPAKKKRLLAVGDYIVEGDSIVTGKDGELHLDMEDGGYLSVRPNTKMRIVKYQAKGESTDSGVIGLLEGSFRSITGWIGKFNRDKYSVRTPTATIGIRGTDHEPYVIPKGSSEGEPGTYDKVNEGGSFIQTPGGRAYVARNQSGFVSHDKAARPRVLKDIPGHFRAGRNERLLAGKHAEVQGRIEKRREDRRGEIRQRLQHAKAGLPARTSPRHQALKEKRDAAQKQREDARKAREETKKGKRDRRKGDDELEPERSEHAGKALRRAHPVNK